MNIFVAGIHGVGKTYLASRLPSESGLKHVSASTLIKEQRALAEWNVDKLVTDVDENQIALAQAVARHNANNTSLLLDGHFVLLGQEGDFIPLGAEVFRALKLSAVVLIEATPEVVASRVVQRDEFYREPKWLANFMRRERAQAELVCTELNLPISVLTSPSDVVFENTLKGFLI